MYTNLLTFQFQVSSKLPKLKFRSYFPNLAYHELYALSWTFNVRKHVSTTHFHLYRQDLYSYSFCYVFYIILTTFWNQESINLMCLIPTYIDSNIRSWLVGYQNYQNLKTCHFQNGKQMSFFHYLIYCLNYAFNYYNTFILKHRIVGIKIIKLSIKKKLTCHNDITFHFNSKCLFALSQLHIQLL